MLGLHEKLLSSRRKKNAFNTCITVGTRCIQIKSKNNIKLKYKVCM